MNARPGRCCGRPRSASTTATTTTRLLALSHKLTIKLPYTFEPGPLGGVLSNLAVAGGSVYVATIDLPVTATSRDSVDGDKAAGPAPGRWRRSASPPARSNGTPRSRRCRSARPPSPTTWSSPTLYNGVLIALNRATGAIVYRHQLPTSANAPIAVFGNTVLVPAGGPETSSQGGGGHPQLVAYTLP